jgi:hypothetical protein
MNENIMKHFEMKLLWENKRIRNRNGKIIDVYVQPERLNPRDALSVCDSPNSEYKENPRDMQK